MVKPDYQTRYFDEKFSNLEGSLSEIKNIIRETAHSASEAHKRIDAWENRLWGVGATSAFGGGGIVAIIQHFLK